MLVVISGLPGTGKSTIAKKFAAKHSATYVRVDEIENAIRSTRSEIEIGPLGYSVAFAIARSNLALGNVVVADCVNPVPESRQGWHNAAKDAGTGFLDIEVICSNRDEHRRRVETRPAEIAGHQHPTWVKVTDLNYTPWTTERMLIDTATRAPDQAVADISAHLKLSY